MAARSRESANLCGILFVPVMFWGMYLRLQLLLLLLLLLLVPLLLLFLPLLSVLLQLYLPLRLRLRRIWNQDGCADMTATEVTGCETKWQNRQQTRIRICKRQHMWRTRAWNTLNKSKRRRRYLRCNVSSDWVTSHRLRSQNGKEIGSDSHE